MSLSVLITVVSTNKLSVVKFSSLYERNYTYRFKFSLVLVLDYQHVRFVVNDRGLFIVG